MKNNPTNENKIIEYFKSFTKDISMEDNYILNKIFNYNDQQGYTINNNFVKHLKVFLFDGIRSLYDVGFGKTYKDMTPEDKIITSILMYKPKEFNASVSTSFIQLPPLSDSSTNMVLRVPTIKNIRRPNNKRRK